MWATALQFQQQPSNKVTWTNVDRVNQLRLPEGFGNPSTASTDPDALFRRKAVVVMTGIQ